LRALLDRAGGAERLTSKKTSLSSLSARRRCLSALVPEEEAEVVVEDNDGLRLATTWLVVPGSALESLLLTPLFLLPPLAWRLPAGVVGSRSSAGGAAWT
jgi:hypothetical protein